MWVEEKFLVTQDFYFYNIHVVVKPVTFLESWNSVFLILKMISVTYHGRSYSTLPEISYFSPQTFTMHYPLLCGDCKDQVRTPVLQRTLSNSNYGEYNGLTRGNIWLNIWNGSLRGQSFVVAVLFCDWIPYVTDTANTDSFLSSCVYIYLCVYSFLCIYWWVYFQHLEPCQFFRNLLNLENHKHLSVCQAIWLFLSCQFFCKKKFWISHVLVKT